MMTFLPIRIMVQMKESLVLYNNKFSDTHGWIKTAAPTLIKAKW